MPPFPYLAVAEQTVNTALSGIERAGTWSDHVLVIALIVLICGAAVALLRYAFKQTSDERKGRDQDRKEYIDSLKGIAQLNAVALDRNTAAFSKLEGLKESADRMAAAVTGMVAVVNKLDLDWRIERRVDGPRAGPNARREE